MKNITLPYTRPFISMAEMHVNPALYEEAVELYNDKKYRDAIIKVLEYIKPDLLKDVDTSKPFKINTNQAIIPIEFEVSATDFSILAPYLKMTEQTNLIALKRKVLELNFHPLNLSQMKIKDNQIDFKFTCSIEGSHPNKIHSVIYDTVLDGEYFQDKFVMDYGAVPFSTKNKKELSEADYQKALDQIKMYLTDYEKYLNHFEEQGWNDLQFDLVVIAILKLGNMPWLQGVVKAELQEYTQNLFNADIDFDFRVNKGKSFLKKLIQKPDDFWKDHIYLSTELINSRKRASVNYLKDYCKRFAETVESYEKDESYFLLSYFLQVQFLRMINTLRLGEQKRKVLERSLEQAAEKTNFDASIILVNTFNLIKEGNWEIPNDGQAKNKGFFQKLFRL